MKDFEHFVNLVFCGNTELDKKPYMPGINSDTIMAIGDLADAGRYNDIIDHFKDVAHQWRDQKENDLTKTISDITEDKFLEHFSTTRSSEEPPDILGSDWRSMKD